MSKSHQRGQGTNPYVGSGYQGNPGCADAATMIKDAMKEEKKAARYYRYLADKTHCREEKDLLQGIRADEKRHYCMLGDLYQEVTCDKYEVDKVRVKKPCEFCEGLKSAICDELDTISAYERLAYALPNIKQKEVVCCILNDEREHAQKLAALYKRSRQCCTCEKCQHKRK